MKKSYGVVAAVAAPHAPQLLSLPESEDHEQVARIKGLLGDIGTQFEDKDIDVVIILSNDHGDHFVTHSVPPFTVHVGAQAQGMQKHSGAWTLSSDLAYELVPEMSNLGFDLAFTLNADIPTAFTIPFEFMGFDRQQPMLPIFVNAYIPPQPSAQRCYAFGQALERALCKLQKRALLIASGGFSHFPGTDRYTKPDVGTDKIWYERITQGDLQFVSGLSEEEMDDSGNVELRSLQILAGVLGGNRKPFATQFEPSWHHTYVTFAWDLEAPAPAFKPAYPRLSAQRAELVQALYVLRTDEQQARRYLADQADYCDQFSLDDESRAALMALNEVALRDELGMHPLLTAGALRHIGILKEKINQEA